MDKQSAKKESCSSCVPEEQTSARPKSKKKSTAAAGHTDHTASLKRLNRVKGQLEAVSRMIENQEYCLNILQQIRAAGSALRGLEAEVLRGHLKGCVRSAFDSKRPFEASEKIEEIIALWQK